MKLTTLLLLISMSALIAAERVITFDYLPMSKGVVATDDFVVSVLTNRTKKKYQLVLWDDQTNSSYKAELPNDFSILYTKSLGKNAALFSDPYNDRLYEINFADKPKVASYKLEDFSTPMAIEANKTHFFASTTSFVTVIKRSSGTTERKIKTIQRAAQLLLNGDHVIVKEMPFGGADEISVFNWKTGEEIARHITYGKLREMKRYKDEVCYLVHKDKYMLKCWNYSTDAIRKIETKVRPGTLEIVDGKAWVYANGYDFEPEFITPTLTAYDLTTEQITEDQSEELKGVDHVRKMVYSAKTNAFFLKDDKGLWKISK